MKGLPARLRPDAAPRPLVIDRASLLDGCLVIAGWVGAAHLPRLHFRGRPHRRHSVAAVARPDAAAALGPDHDILGFRFAVALAEGERPEDFTVVHGRQALSLPDLAVRRRGSEPERHFASLRDRFLAEISPPRARVLELGSRARSGDTYRHLFPAGTQFTGLDIVPGPSVDVVGDAHHLTRHVRGRYDFIFSVSVFEHLLMPWKVAVEMARVLETGGLAYVQSHAAWPLHDEPWDFLRFSREAWHGLFNAATGFEIVDTGYSAAAAVVPQIAEQGALAGLAEQRTFLLSACLARKVAEPIADWVCEAGEIYDLAYSHGAPFA